MRIRRPRLVRVVLAAIAALALGPTRSAPVAALAPPSTLDALLQARHGLTGRSRVIVRADAPGWLTVVPLLGGHVVRQLPLIGGAVVDLPNVALAALAANPHVLHVSADRAIAGANERTGATVGATAVRS